MAAVDGWYDGLSATSQKSMDAKDRIGGLKAALDGSLEKAAAAVEKEVGSSIQAWRSEHEETLIKSKRFAKKNFDALQKLIPQLAGAILKKTNESGRKLTKGMVRKSVFRTLDKHFNTQGVLMESLVKNRWSRITGEENVSTPSQVIVEDVLTQPKKYDEDALIKSRWTRMAGLGDDNEKN